jgi:hypothetical protein
MLLVLIPVLVNGQHIRKTFEAEVQRGWILPHSEELEVFRGSVPTGIQLRYQRMGGTRKNWESCHCFHYLGLSLSIQDFGNSDELGQAISLSGNFEPILIRARRFEVSLGMGAGISYLTQVYDEQTNPRNTFFSAPVSFLLFVTPRFWYQASDRIMVNTSFSYQHISNGGQQKPNRGMNYPMVGVGVAYLMSSSEYPEFDNTSFKPSWRFYGGMGFTLSDAESEGRKPVINFDAGAYRHILPVIGLGGGVEWTLDQTIDPGGGMRHVVGLYVANHFLFGRFDFSQHIAWYAERPSGYMRDKAIYQRYLLEMLVGEHLRVGAGLKAHGQVAELLEIRAGWLF